MMCARQGKLVRDHRPAIPKTVPVCSLPIPPRVAPDSAGANENRLSVQD